MELWFGEKKWDFRSFNNIDLTTMNKNSAKKHRFFDEQTFMRIALKPKEKKNICNLSFIATCCVQCTSIVY